MLDFKTVNDKDRAWFNKDFSRVLSLTKLIRMSLLTGESLAEEDYSEFFDFEPNVTIIYVSLFQKGKKHIRWGSRRETFIRTINRDLEMIRANKRFSEFDVKNDIDCRIMIEVMYDRKVVKPQDINIQKFDDNRFEPGITGVEVQDGNRAYFYMPTDAITYSHLSLSNAINHVASKMPIGKMTNRILERLNYVAKSCIHYFFKSRALITYKDSIIPLYRGNLLYPEFDYNLMLSEILKSADWLVKNMHEDGRFLYYYDCCNDNYIDHEHPTRPLNNLYYNDLRHCGGIIALLNAYLLTNNEVYLKVAKSALDWSMTILREHETGFGSGYYAYYNQKAKLGGTGVLVVAIMRYRLITKDTQYDEYLDGLVRHLVSRISDSGEMLGYYIHPAYHNGEPLINMTDEERKATFSFYYPGEALLGLALYANTFDNELSILVKREAQKALDWIVDERPKLYKEMFTSLPSDAWLMQAIEEWVKNPRFKKNNLINFVYRDADKMVSMTYNKDDSPYLDYEGGYYYNYGDHLFPDGARSEGLVAAYYMAKYLGDTEREKIYLEACKKTAKSQFPLFNCEEYTYGHLNPEKSVNSIRFKATRQWVRVDSIQHVSCFFARLYMAKNL